MGRLRWLSFNFHLRFLLLVIPLKISWSDRKPLMAMELCKVFSFKNIGQYICNIKFSLEFPKWTKRPIFILISRTVIPYKNDAVPCKILRFLLDISNINWNSWLWLISGVEFEAGFFQCFKFLKCDFGIC